jgi:hypothetical protein
LTQIDQHGGSRTYTVRGQALLHRAQGQTQRRTVEVGVVVRQVDGFNHDRSIPTSLLHIMLSNILFW